MQGILKLLRKCFQKESNEIAMYDLHDNFSEENQVALSKQDYLCIYSSLRNDYELA